MSRCSLPRRRLLGAAPLVAPLLGCSLLPDPLAPRMYRLNPALSSRPAKPSIRDTLAIALPTAPDSLDTDRIALTRGPTRFEYYADSTWTDRLPPLLHTLLLEAFEDDGRVANVTSGADAAAHGYVLRTAIRRFEAQYASLDAREPDIVVALDLRLTLRPDGRQMGRTLIVQHARCLQNRMESIVEAFTTATAAALRQTVAWTTEQMSRLARA